MFNSLCTFTFLAVHKKYDIYPYTFSEIYSGESTRFDLGCHSIVVPVIRCFVVSITSTR